MEEIISKQVSQVPSENVAFSTAGTEQLLERVLTESYSKMQNGLLSLESERNEEIIRHLLFQNTLLSDAEMASALNCY